MRRRRRTVKGWARATERGVFHYYNSRVRTLCGYKLLPIERPYDYIHEHPANCKACCAARKQLVAEEVMA